MATIRQIKVTFIVVLMEAFAVFLLFNFHTSSASARDQFNDKLPSVNIIAPKNNSIYDWNSSGELQYCCVGSWKINEI